MREVLQGGSSRAVHPKAVQRPLLIQYAVDQATGAVVSADSLAQQMEDPRSLLRLRAVSREGSARGSLRMTCPACGQRLYPHAPRRRQGRYFWSHFGGEAGSCPLEAKRPLCLDDINRLIFQGRQEGEAHRALVQTLLRLASQDPGTVPGTALAETYIAPNGEMATEHSHGRFPDVAFTHGQQPVVLEAQLATIALHGINGRREFYDEIGIALLWVMRGFDPNAIPRASVRDIIADQRGNVFSLDRDVEELSERDGRFRLRIWTYTDQGERRGWSQRVGFIEECIEVAAPRRWADDFQARWLAAYRGRSYHDPSVPDPRAMVGELLAKAQYEPAGRLPREILPLVRLLISLKHGVVAGARHPRLISLANSFDREAGAQAMNLVLLALRRWAPELLEEPSVKNAFQRASLALCEAGLDPWDRDSLVGRVREVLFPEWKLARRASRHDD